MNRKHLNLTGVLAVLLALAAVQTSQAQDIGIDIDSAEPNTTEQGTFGQAISIKGDGFDNSVREVRFLVHCDPQDPNCVDDPGGITVTGFSVNSATEIAATIDVSDSARLSKFDIAITTRGRGGKGTTFRSAAIFEVTLRPNQQLVQCDDILQNPLGTCTCQFSWEGNDNIYGLLDHCVTSETLKLRSTIRTAGSIQANGTERLSITAVPCDSDNGQNCSTVGEGNFRGSAVIGNAYHRANIRYVDIRFGPGAYGTAPPRGCKTDGSEITAAVRFALDAGTPDPKTTLPEAQPDTTFRNSLLYVHDLSIASDDDPLCNAVEVMRTPIYTARYSNLSEPEPARDWKISVNNVEVTAGSYLEAGVVMLGIMPHESINPPNVFNNTIGAAGCDADHPVVPVGILFGDLTPDPENQIEGVVESNTIDMWNGCGNSFGVQVVSDVDDNGSETTVKVNKNAIAGTDVGVYVDCGVQEAGFSGNSLTGIEDVTDDIGILSDAVSTSTKGKPNKWQFYLPEDELVVERAGCP